LYNILGFEIEPHYLPLIAALIGATATMSAALINLRIAWKKELKARAEKKPVNKANNRGPVITVIVLMIASGIGGWRDKKHKIKHVKLNCVNKLKC
jgi:hypothetical protein